MKLAILSRGPHLYSTKSLQDAALSQGHEVIVIDYTKCFVVMEMGQPSIYYQSKKLDNIDAIIPRIGASLAMFGASIVRQFEMLGVITTAKAQAIEVSKHKLKSLQLLSKHSVAIPKTAFAKLPKSKDIDALIEQVGGVPLVIKLLEGTQGLGVVLVETKSAARSVIEAFSSLRANIIVQEFIEEAKGSDIRAMVVDGSVVAAMKRQGAEGEFRSNLHRGGEAQQVTLSKEEEETAIKAVEALNLSVAGVDLIQSSKGPLIMEVNSSPGLRGVEQSTGINVALSIVESLERKVQKRKDSLDMAIASNFT